ncbi:hypothetical protein EVG20_g8464 [Dentipellis fragilis]|uniref:Uncharacterized protein n=1 Tax=Dentipellis fragilis TaxID=205917 RepID=A0A4Y9Y883_9AGAM|nr:hypothetical protein EVG20_g8464 [Dentipellis fragilis]
MDPLPSWRDSETSPGLPRSKPSDLQGRHIDTEGLNKGADLAEFLALLANIYDGDLSAILHSTVLVALVKSASKSDPNRRGIHFAGDASASARAIQAPRYVPSICGRGAILHPAETPTTRRRHVRLSSAGVDALTNGRGRCKYTSECAVDNLHRCCTHFEADSGYPGQPRATVWREHQMPQVAPPRSTQRKIGFPTHPIEEALQANVRSTNAQPAGDTEETITYACSFVYSDVQPPPC